MRKKTFTGKLMEYERKNNSYYGNPKYSGTFENEDGETLRATTASNASCAYMFLNYPEKTRTILYHVTKAGNNIIEYIEIDN